MPKPWWPATGYRAQQRRATHRGLRCGTSKDRSVLAAAHERLAVDLGELSVLVLAKEIAADLLLVDDLAARRLARAEGFRVQGAVGIVEACFIRGYLKDLPGAFGELLAQGVFLDAVFLNARLKLLNLPPLSDS
jgi:predicted nucleic acid-binding protein